MSKDIIPHPFVLTTAIIKLHIEHSGKKAVSSYSFPSLRSPIPVLYAIPEQLGLIKVHSNMSLQRKVSLSSPHPNAQTRKTLLRWLPVV